MDGFFSATRHNGFKTLCRDINKLTSIKTDQGKNFVHVCVESHPFSFIHINSYMDVYPDKIDYLFEEFDSNGESPVMLAARTQPKVFREMLRIEFFRKLMTTHVNKTGEDCFVVAVLNHPNVLSVVCEKYPPTLEYTNDNGDTLLHLSARSNPQAVANIRGNFKKHKPEMINRLNNQQDTYLHLMIKNYSEYTLPELTYGSTELPELMKLCGKLHYYAVLNFNQEHTPLILQTLNHQINNDLLMELLDIICDKHDVVKQLIGVYPQIKTLLIPMLAKQLQIRNRDKFNDILNLTLIYAKLSKPHEVSFVTAISKLGVVYSDLFNILIKQKLDDETFDIFLEMFLQCDLNGHWGHVYHIWTILYQHPEYLKKFLHSPKVTNEHVVLFYVNRFSQSQDQFEICTMLTDIIQVSPSSLQIFLDSPRFNRDFYHIHKTTNNGLYLIDEKTSKVIDDRTTVFDPAYVMMKKFLIDGIDL